MLQGEFYKASTRVWNLFTGKSFCVNREKCAELIGNIGPPIWQWLLGNFIIDEEKIYSSK